jgi:tetratricopeptide (TPR) repeat protein
VRFFASASGASRLDRGFELAAANAEIEERSFYLNHFSRNIIELDIVRICFFSSVRGRTASLDWIKRNTVFRYVKPSILENSVRNRLLSEENPSEYVIALKGAQAFLYVLADITARIAQGRKPARNIADEMFAEGLILGGPAGDIVNHNRLIRAILGDLSRTGIVRVDKGDFELSASDQRTQRTREAVVQILSRMTLRTRDRVDSLLSGFKEAFGVEELPVRSLIELARSMRNSRSVMVLLDHVSQVDLPIEEILSDLKLDAIEKNDDVARAALASLEADVTNDEQRREKLHSESWIGLAVFCKRIGLLERAKGFYLKASEIFTKHPEYGNAKVQIANALECERRMKAREGDFAGAIRICSEEEATWSELGRNKEAVYCKCMKLEMQSHAAEDIGDCLRAAGIMRQCSELASTLSEERRISCLEIGTELEAQHFERLGDYDECAKRLETAASLCQKLGNVKKANRLLGRAHQSKAIDYRQNVTHRLSEIASEFRIAKEKYELAECEEAAKICESDFCKFSGLDAKDGGKFDEAVLHFQKGQAIVGELVRYFPMRRTKHALGVQYFEGIILETVAQRDMLPLIQKRENLDDSIGRFRRAGDIFAQLGDEKHAEIDYCLAVILMAVEKFHESDIGGANQLLNGAKQRLPADFSFSILEDQVNENWQPLRYTLHMIEEFNKYSRKIETEKGFSFESRAREVLKREYPVYRDVDSKSFIPDDDEEGIVFPGKRPIEIDAFGLREDHRKIHLLVGEVKNQQQPVDTSAVELFRKKLEFVRRRYLKNARLESLEGSEVEIPLYISRSGFTSEALDKARSLGVACIDRDGINAIASKHGMRSIP